MSDSSTQPAPKSDARARRRALRRTIAAVLVVAGVCVGVVVTRALWQGKSALSAGDEALLRGDHDEAISRWRRAARWYMPGASHVGDAYDRLETLAREAESKGDIATALAAWRGIRGSIMATRSFYTPHRHRLDPANQRIAALMAQLESTSEAHDSTAAASATPSEHKQAPERAYEWHYRLLRRDPGPSVLWSLVAILGFALWLGGGFLFALRGITREDTLAPRTAMYAGVMIASGLIVWMLGLYLA